MIIAPLRPRASGFKFGQKSERELQGVHPALVAVTRLALTLSTQDFGVFDGIRTAQEQNSLFRRKASQRDGYNRKSEHQVQDTGYGHAVDLVPWHGGRYVWDWDMIYPIAEAMTEASKALDVSIRWGGCWGDTAIKDLTGAPENWVQEYVRRKQKAGQRAFNDGPHYELLGNVVWKAA